MAKKKTLTILVAMVLGLGLVLPTYSFASAKETEEKDQVAVVDQIPQQTPVKVSVKEEAPTAGEGESENLVSAEIGSDLAIVGVTWSETVSETPQIKYRTLGKDKVWSQWQNIDAEKGESEQRASGTEPIVVTEVSQVQVQATVPDSSTVEGLKVTVINPGVGVGDSQANPNKNLARLRSAEDARGIAIHSRSDWGADEKLMTWPPKSIKPQGVAIHHTAGTNNYSATQVPGILRGIYYFHAVTRNWGDIGYNVLVDKYGRAWQGRRGTFQNPSEGAHARSVNGVTFGISVLGTYETQAPPWAAQDTVTRLAAAQLKLRGVNPLGTFTFRGHTFNRISGHRDFVVLGTGNNTACPGNAFYRQLGEIRQQAATLAAGWASGKSSRVNRTFDGEKLLFDDSGNAVSLSKAKKQISIGQPKQLGRIVETGSRVFAAGDWDGDHKPDLISISRDGKMWLHSGGNKRYLAKRRIGHGWNTIDSVVTGLDWDGDGNKDVIGRVARDGRLFLYPGNGKGTFKRARQIGHGWHGFTGLVGVSKFMHGRPAILAQNKQGGLFTYAGNGRGRFAEIFQSGWNWGSIHTLIGAKDWTVDRVGDLLAVRNDGALIVYPGNGRGCFGRTQDIGTGWSAFSTVLDVNDASTSGTTLFGISSNGEVKAYPAKFFKDPVTKSPHLASTMTIPAGNWDADSSADVITRSTDGNLMLHANGNATAVQIGSGWSRFNEIVAAPSWNLDELPYLLTYRRSDGELLYYKANQNGRFTSSDVIGYYPGMKQLVYLADFLGHPEPTVGFIKPNGDFMTLDRSSGSLRRIGHGWQNYRSVIGGTDVNNDGRPDVIAQSPGAIRVYYGAARGGFGRNAVLKTLPAGLGQLR